MHIIIVIKVNSLSKSLSQEKKLTCVVNIFYSYVSMFQMKDDNIISLFTSFQNFHILSQKNSAKNNNTKHT